MVKCYMRSSSTKLCFYIVSLVLLYRSNSRFWFRKVAIESYELDLLGFVLEAPRFDYISSGRFSWSLNSETKYRPS